MAINTAGQTFAPANQITGDGMPKFASGSVTLDATAITAADYLQVNVGFVPKYFQWENQTDRVKGEWDDQMAQDSCLKTVAAGTRTLEVTGGNKGIVVGQQGVTTTLSGTSPNPGQVQISQNATLALILASKVCRWKAWG